MPINRLSLSCRRALWTGALLAVVAMSAAADSPSRNDESTDHEPTVLARNDTTENDGHAKAAAKEDDFTPYSRERNCVGLDSVIYASVGAGLSESEKAALDRLYVEEHRAQAAYQTIRDQFGRVRVYANVLRAQGRHIAALEKLYSRYGIEKPDTTVDDVPAFETLDAALAWSAHLESKLAAQYDECLAATDKSDVTKIFTTLRNASRDQHGPAFERMLARR